MPYKNCYSCFYGGDGEEVNDYGHCWKHNGEPDFRQPPKDQGCDEWKSNDDFAALVVTDWHGNGPYFL